MSGWLLDYAGRVLLHDDGDGVYRLPGGPPQHRDHDLAASLRRLVLEEAHVTITEAVPLGYQPTIEAGQPRVLASMVGRIGEILPRSGHTPPRRRTRRLLTSLDVAPALLGSRATGTEQAVAAALFAENRWDLRACSPLAFTTYAD
ncbi:hypothetical protein GCM10023321_14420 [Pseudonocardia eucalypti]|uniref:Nudix hydrolase domain-containing protein n=1 Tax=Pseudonocardia eucalypti TaxID=648755 RepID=A0ABP9PPM7_9PSEU|nr:hypothetical protein [Pseudonocardia eucalypti]